MEHTTSTQTIETSTRPIDRSQRGGTLVWRTAHDGSGRLAAAWVFPQHATTGTVDPDGVVLVA
ncbi:MAG: hypothetical protein AAF467_02440 [Actinomycetota bacterium]